MLLILILTTGVGVVSGSQPSPEEDLFLTGYDCSNAVFHANLTLPHFLSGFRNETEIDFTAEDAEVQLLQVSTNENVRVVEVKVTKLETVQQCGNKPSWSWSWWYELTTGVYSEDLQLTAKELQNIVANKRIAVGAEYQGYYHPTEIPLDDGKTKKKIVPIGAIQHDLSNSGRPECMGQEYRDIDGKIHPNAVVIATYTIVKKTLSATMSSTGQVNVGSLEDCYLTGSSSVCFDIYTGM